MLSDKQLRAYERLGAHIGSHIIRPYDPKYLEVMDGNWWYTSFRGVDAEDRRNATLRVTRATIIIGRPRDDANGLWRTQDSAVASVFAEKFATPDDFVQGIATARENLIKKVTRLSGSRELFYFSRPHKETQAHLHHGWITLPLSVQQLKEHRVPAIRLCAGIPVAKPSNYKATVEAAWLLKADTIGVVGQTADVQLEVKPLQKQFKREIDRMLGWTTFMERREFANRGPRRGPADYLPFKAVLAAKGISVDAWNLLPPHVAVRIGEELMAQA